MLAHQRGLRTVNVVRRPELAAELKQLGADLVIVDGDDLAARVARETGEAPIKLGARGDRRQGDRPAVRLRRERRHGRALRLDERAEPRRQRATTSSIAASSSPASCSAASWRGAIAQQIREIYAALAQQVMDGRLYAPVDTVYPIEQIKEALAHADKGGRNGKILVSPNGAI